MEKDDAQISREVESLEYVGQAIGIALYAYHSRRGQPNQLAATNLLLDELLDGGIEFNADVDLILRGVMTALGNLSD